MEVEAIKAVESYRICRDKILGYIDELKTNGNLAAEVTKSSLKSLIIIEFDECAVKLLRGEECE